VPHVEAAVGDRVRLRVRARDVALARGATEGISIRNRLRGTIVALVREEGAFAECSVDIGGQQLRARLTRLAADELGLEVGSEVTALLRVAAVERRLVQTRPASGT
jgi:molybdate transport system ATP-binding protein